MRAGRLRRKLHILEHTESRDAFGGVTHAWTLADVLWGEWLDTGGSEREEQGAVVADTDVTVRVRYRDDITTRQRVKDPSSGRQASIESITDEDGRRRVLTLQCREVEPDAQGAD